MARSAWLPAASCFSAGAITVPRLTDIAFCAWVAQAEPGDWLEYHRGVLAVDRLKTISDLTREYVLTQLAYARQREAVVEAVYFIQRRDTRTWGDVVAHGEFSGRSARVEIHPGLTAPEAHDEAPHALCSIVWRALAILSEAGSVSEQNVSRIHRPKLARAGVRGWPSTRSSATSSRHRSPPSRPAS